MLKGKQRSYVKKLANPMKPLLQIGKDGLTENVMEQLDKLLNDHEIVKVHVLSNSLLDAKETAFEVCEELKSDFISALGNKFVVYRESRLKSRDERLQLPK
jgi:RNA-binding protein